MKQFLLVISLILQIIQSQAQLSDDFTDGNFSDSPGWNGDISDFIVNSEFQLQLNASIAGNSTLSTAYEIPDSCVWEFYLKMDFAPSSSNLLRIYLQSSSGDLLPGKGYYLEIGESGNTDAIRFFRQDGPLSKVLLGSGTVGSLSSQPAVAQVKITRSGIGNWIIACDYSGGNNFQQEFNLTDNIYLPGQAYFGVYCLYTETRKDKFFFDDIKCYQLTKDLQGPIFKKLVIVDQNHLDLIFDENLNKSIVETISNYELKPDIGNPSQATLDLNSLNILHLEFGKAFINQTSYILSIQKITDLFSNILNPFDAPFNYNVGIAPSLNEILITEIFADPIPQIGLPLTEFVEIYNKSNNYLSLNGLSFSDGTITSLLPDILFPPLSYFILCNKADTNAYKNLGPTVGLLNFPSLNNTGDILSIKNEDGDLINTVNYTDSWYNNSDKKEGGWSLELINPASKCSGLENWSSSIDTKGGTPGQQNSIFNSVNDITPPVFLSALNIDEYTLQLSFNETLSEDVILSGSLFSIDPEIIILSIQLNLDHHQLILKIDKPLSPGIIYNIQLLAGLSDCSGNQTTDIQSNEILLPSVPGLHDIVINEILFNPRSGAYDFIELYNRSDKIFNVSNLIVANTINGIDERSFLTLRLLSPGEYIVLTESPDNIKMEYEVKDSTALYKMDLPSFNDDNGKIELTFKNINGSILIDSFYYDVSFHYALLSDVEGVSLERINPNSFSSGSTNWQSASKQSGYGTPTYKNSQYNINPQILDGSFSLSSKKFSPDSDGFEDQVQISYSLVSPGYTLNIDIYDSSGRMIRKIADNELIGSEGSFKWDGTTDENTKAHLGIYIIFIEYFNLTGTVLQQKLPVVVAGKIN